MLEKIGSGSEVSAKERLDVLRDLTVELTGEERHELAKQIAGIGLSAQNYGDARVAFDLMAKVYALDLSRDVEGSPIYVKDAWHDSGITLQGGIGGSREVADKLMEALKKFESK